jgi:catechol 2,3-dioxygenase-like lactoylglutathione lyase family enzyme
MKSIIILLSACATVLFSLTLAVAAPVPEDERTAIDLRRTTITVRNVDVSLALYRDVLGMKVIYDRPVRTPSTATSDEEADIARRLVFLRANDDFIGILGLLEYVKPEREPAPLDEDPRLRPGEVVLLFNTKNLAEKFDQVKSTPGVRVISEPTRVDYPSYDGTGKIPVLVSTFWDPDGIFVELNELLINPEDLSTGVE